MPKRSPILGCIERLDDTRIVFLGERENDPDTFFLDFRNSEGGDTKLILSTEALNAIVRLRERLPTVAAHDRVCFPPANKQEQWHWVAKVVDESVPSE